jgi:hypothetical protein
MGLVQVYESEHYIYSVVHGLNMAGLHVSKICVKILFTKYEQYKKTNNMKEISLVMHSSFHANLVIHYIQMYSIVK